MMSDIMLQLEAKAKKNPLKVVFPEAKEISILKAAVFASKKGVAQPILIGNIAEIENIAKDNALDLKGIEIKSNLDEEVICNYVDKYFENNQVFSKKKLTKWMNKELYFGAMMVALGDADAMVAGYAHTTSDVILASRFIIGLKEGINVASSIFLMDIPTYTGSEGNLIILSDGGVCEMPNSSELADIAITTAETAKALLNWNPRLAMLSYSTKGSASGPAVEKVIEATELVRNRRPDLKIDGELQLDAAIVSEVARKKVGNESPVAGKANILIVPDLTVGNILYKGIQRFANAKAYGPFLQGFSKTVSDLSRGSSVDDIYGVIVMAVVHAQNTL